MNGMPDSRPNVARMDRLTAALGKIAAALAIATLVIIPLARFAVSALSTN